MSLNTWAPAGDAVSGSYVTFRSWNLAKGSTSMWADFDVLQPYLASCFFLSHFSACVLDDSVINQLLMLLNIFFLTIAMPSWS